ncbi:MAG: hypothetical protein K1Y02_15305 [Candidatus Hydrogenedentes bacterium]|nr:hypothetical protein [Candidatus Hydrogenedentota bacterium]
MLRGSVVAAAVLLCAGCPPSKSSLSQALGFLQVTQTTSWEESTGASGSAADFEGDWPQFFHFKSVPNYRIREVSPFVVAFIHHALTLIHESNADALGLSQAEIDAARNMRQRAVLFMKRFESAEGEPDAHTYGFWPHDRNSLSPISPLETLAQSIMKGPLLGGDRVPLNLDYFPRALAIPTDADVTATTYTTLLDDALLDGGPGPAVSFEQFFADWRDTGAIPLRLTPDWLPHASGAYLTWLSYLAPPDAPIPNDVDLVVDANVLYALARHGKTDTPGFAETVALINSAVQQGLHRTRFEDLSSYYPDSFVFHYCVSRAYFEGPVPGLAAAVNALADDLEASARIRADGTVCWDKGDPHLNTAFAVLTLLNAGRDSELLDGAIDYLQASQDPRCGSWNEAVFFIARTDGGQVIEWESSALTTAMALEAIARFRLQD